jgi:hypothetical protein
MYRKLKSLSLEQIIEKDVKKNSKKTQHKKNEEIVPEMKLSMYEKNNIIFDLFEKLDKKKKLINKSSINHSFFRDLNIFDKDPNSIFNMINKNRTLLGEISSKILLYFPVHDIELLQKRQQIIKTLNKSHNSIDTLLINFKKIEEDLLWLFHKRTEEEDDYFKSLYFTSTYLQFLNKIPLCLTIYHFYFTIITPFTAILSPIVSFLVSYITLRFITGVNIGMWKFYKLFKLGMGGMLTPILGPWYPLLSTLGYGFMYIMGGYNTITNIMKRMEKCKIIYQKLSAISKLVKTINSINFILMKENIFEYFWTDQLEKDFNTVNKIYSNNDSYGYFKNWGNILYIFSKIDVHSDCISNLMKYIGTIDSYMSIVKLQKSKSICLSKFVKLNNPLVEIKNLIHPTLSNNKNVISNDINLNKIRNILLFGPNASGKSLFIKSLVINILLSQTLTISYCKSIKLTPFAILNTYLNIPDMVGKESLFEAEVHRCKDYINRIKKAKKTNFALTVFDELFSSTNYYEGISTSYAICKYLSKFPNSVNIITTHFHKLSKIEKENLFKCYSMKVSQKDNGDIRFHYKLEQKLEKKKLAIELLRMKSLDKEIIDCALKFYNDTFMKKKKKRKRKKKKNKKELIIIEN